MLARVLHVYSSHTLSNARDYYCRRRRRQRRSIMSNMNWMSDSVRQRFIAHMQWNESYRFLLHECHDQTLTSALRLHSCLHYCSASAWCRINLRITYTQNGTHTCNAIFPIRLHFLLRRRNCLYDKMRCSTWRKSSSPCSPVNDSCRKEFLAIRLCKVEEEEERKIYSCAIVLSLHFVFIWCVRVQESARLFVCARLRSANKIVAKQQLYMPYCLSSPSGAVRRSDKRSANRVATIESDAGECTYCAASNSAPHSSEWNRK